MGSSTCRKMSCTLSRNSLSKIYQVGWFFLFCFLSVSFSVLVSVNLRKWFFKIFFLGGLGGWGWRWGWASWIPEFLLWKLPRQEIPGFHWINLMPQLCVCYGSRFLTNARKWLWINCKNWKLLSFLVPAGVFSGFSVLSNFTLIPALTLSMSMIIIMCYLKKWN